MGQLETKYACILLDTRDKASEKLTDQVLLGDWGWKLCQDAYKTEMKCIAEMGGLNQLDEHTFHIEPGYTVLAVTPDKKCIGFASIYVDIEAQTIILGHVYVRPEFREKGVFKTMLARIEKFAKDTKMKQIVSFVYRANGGSMKAHHNLGFKQQMVGYMKEVK